MENQKPVYANNQIDVIMPRIIVKYKSVLGRGAQEGRGLWVAVMNQYLLQKTEATKPGILTGFHFHGLLLTLLSRLRKHISLEMLEMCWLSTETRAFIIKYLYMFPFIGNCISFHHTHTSTLPHHSGSVG